MQGREEVCRRPCLGSSFLFRLAAGLALSALGAIMFTLAFPPYDLWFLAYFWMIPVMVSLHRVMPERLSGLAMGVGVGGFFWGYFAGMFEGYPFMQWLPLFIGIIATIIGFRERPFHRRTGYRWFVLQGAALWVGIEMIRGWIPMVGTWGFAAYTMYQHPWFIQPISIFGIYGLSLLIMLINFALAQLVLALIDKYRHGGGKEIISPGRAIKWTAVAGVLLLAWGVGSFNMHEIPEPDLPVAAVQPAAHISREAGEEGIEKGLHIIEEKTREASARGARFIVWPEGYLPFDPQEKETPFFKELAGETEAYLAIGYVLETEKGFRNEATVLSPGGEFLGVYGKDHPVTFAGETSITRGTYPVYSTELGNLGTIICYDLDFTDTARKIAANGAQVIGVPSFDWPAIAHKHYTHVIFRAVENRVSMIKADVAYNSAIIDAYGNIVDLYISREPEEAVLVGKVPRGSSHSLQIKLGDWIGWISLAFMLSFLGLDVYSSLRKKNYRIKRN